MNRFTFSLVALFATLTAIAQTKFWVYKNNGTQIECLISEVDSISFTDPSTLTVSPTTKSFDSKGGQFSISVSSNTAWSVTSNQTWATLSTASGSGDGSVTVTVAENKMTTSDNATITIKTSTKTATVSVSRNGMTPTPVGDKCKASDYPQVTIGTQIWMAENYRCSVYDTESEAYKDGRTTVSTSSSAVFTPYYTDASDKSKWYIKYGDYSGNLTDAQVAKLGYLYNWAAAVGVADGTSQTSAFSGNRQGICPNGWHVPTSAEWQTLKDYIEVTQGKGSDTAGKYLKTTSGWYSGDSSYKPGLDTYGFAALPAGYANGGSAYGVGGSNYFWTATPSESISDYTADTWNLHQFNDDLQRGSYVKDTGRSVRCLKN